MSGTASNRLGEDASETRFDPSAGDGRGSAPSFEHPDPERLLQRCTPAFSPLLSSPPPVQSASRSALGSRRVLLARNRQNRMRAWWTTCVEACPQGAASLARYQTKCEHRKARVDRSIGLSVSAAFAPASGGRTPRRVDRFRRARVLPSERAPAARRIAAP